MFIKIVYCLAFLFTGHLQAKILTTLPELAWVVEQLAPEMKVESLLSGEEDPHFVDASPSFIFKAAQADLLIMNGLDLESGWLPVLIQQSGNAKIQAGRPGLCDASKHVSKVGVLEHYDRSMGDVHPQGNPHFTLSPKQMLKVAQAIKDCIQRNVQVEKLQGNYEQLAKRLRKLSDQIVLNETTVYVYHREFQYLAKDYGLKIADTLENVPGSRPSAAHLAQLAMKAQRERPQLVLASMTNPKNVLEKFKELTGIPFAQVKLHTRKDYEAFIQTLVDAINGRQ